MNFFPVFKNFLSKFWGNVRLSFISKFLNKSKFFGEILERKGLKIFWISVEKIFWGVIFESLKIRFLLANH